MVMMYYVDIVVLHMKWKDRSMPQISIIMPVYNNEHYFPIAVKSILDQNYNDYEIIIIDDGSTDNTGKIADRIGESHDKIKVIHQSNQWIYASFNRGIKEAKGDYIYILNSDDTLNSGILRLMSEKIEKYNPDVIWTKVLNHICDSNQNVMKYDFAKSDERVRRDIFLSTENEIHEAWPMLIKSELIFDQANLYRRCIMQKHQFRNDYYVADRLFNISIIPDIKSCYVMKEPAYNRYIYQQPQMNAGRGKYYGYEHKMFSELYHEYKNLLSKLDIINQQNIAILSQMRIRHITNEIRSLQAIDCPLTLEEKMEKIFLEFIDEEVYSCAEEINKREELESRVLSGVRELLVGEKSFIKNEFCFVYDLLKSLLRYEKTKEDYEIIWKAINHPLNPYHIGKTFWEKLSKEDIF